jgi:spermidine synthase
MVALFFLSGVAGLIYQIVWTRELVLVFGNTMLATSTVLSSFMGGLAAGSFVLGWLIDRRPWPLIRLYAGLEAGIGVYALFFPLLLSAATPLYAALYSAGGGGIAQVNLARFVVCFALISVPTFLMGGTLPVLLKRFAHGSSALGRQTGVFYGWNTVGAVIGTVACGYMLLQALGMRDTTRVAVAINLGVALAAWGLSRRTGESAPPVRAEPPPPRAATPPSYDTTQKLVLAGIGLSGFCALAYEVFWTRMLNLFLQNNIHSFTSILATFLVGIAAGSLVYSRFLSRRRDQVAWFIGLEIAIGMISYLTPFLFSFLHGPLFNNFSSALTPAKTAVIMIGPTVMMGVAVPMAVQICQRGERREGMSVGVVYAVNTVGAILGAFAAGFILLPYLGLHLGVIVVAAANVLAGLLAWLPRLRRPSRLAWSAGFAVLVAVVVAAAPGNLFRGLFERSHPSANILHYREGKIANVVVYDFYKNGYKDLHLNAVEEASSRLWHVQLFKMLGILPVMVHEDPDDALMVAFGAGMSAGACVNYVSELECVDLNPDIEGVADTFKRENLDVYNHPGFTQVVNDGRNALLLADKKYSLIISDATNPKMFDSWTLYSQEFYELVKDRLKPGGVFCQWALIPLPGDAIHVVLNTFRSVFPHMSVWAIYGSTQILMLGTPDRLDIDYEDLVSRLEPIYVESGLEEFGIDRPEKFLSFFLIGEDGLGDMLQGFTTVNTDDLPHVQFRADQDDEGVDAALELVRHQESILDYLSNTDGAPDLADTMRDYEAISRRLHLGFLTHRTMSVREAEVAAVYAGLEDQNVRSALQYGPEKKRYFMARLSEFPHDVNARNSLGFIHWREGALDEAEREFRKAVEAKPDFAAAHFNLARVLMDQGNYDGAVAKLLEVRDLSPTRHMRRAIAAQLNIVHLLRKLEREPESVERHRALGIAYYNDGELLRAIREYRRAAELAPEDGGVLYNLARIFERHGFLDETHAIYSRLAEMLPDESAVTTKRAELAALVGDPARRAAWIRERIVLAEEPMAEDEHPETCDRALAAWHDAEFDGSIEPANLRLAASLYEQSAATHPDDLHAYADAATIRESLGEYTEAAQLWRRASETTPALPGALERAERLELMAEVESGRIGGAEKAAALADIGGSLGRMGEVERSIEFLRRAVELDAGRASVWTALAAAYVEAGLPEEAGAAAERARALEGGRGQVATEGS